MNTEERYEWRLFAHRSIHYWMNDSIQNEEFEVIAKQNNNLPFNPQEDKKFEHWYRTQDATNAHWMPEFYDSEDSYAYIDAWNEPGNESLGFNP